MHDRDGLQVAYLGVALAHYLDLETGEIVDLPLDAEPPGSEARFRRIPTRTEETEARDRELFAESKAARPLRDALTATIGDARAFREVLASDLYVQRAFFTFKNERASLAIEAWLESEGLQ